MKELELRRFYDGIQAPSPMDIYYARVPKAASRSVLTMIENKDGYRSHDEFQASYGEWKYNPVPDDRPMFPLYEERRTQWPSPSFSFSFVRNPWDRLAGAGHETEITFQ